MYLIVMEKLAEELVGAIREFKKFENQVEKVFDCYSLGSRGGTFGIIKQHLWNALYEINPIFDESDETFAFILDVLESRLSNKQAAKKLLSYQGENK